MVLFGSVSGETQLTVVATSVLPLPSARHGTPFRSLRFWILFWNVVESLPSSLSASRLVALPAPDETVIGALPVPTWMSSPVPRPAFLIGIAAADVVAVSLVIALTVLLAPSFIAV